MKQIEILGPSTEETLSPRNSARRCLTVESKTRAATSISREGPILLRRRSTAPKKGGGIENSTRFRCTEQSGTIPLRRL